MPMVLFTFLENFAWNRKKIIPFCIDEGSGLGASVRDIKKISRGADVGVGISLTGSQVKNSEGKIAAWAKSKI